MQKSQGFAAVTTAFRLLRALASRGTHGASVSAASAGISQACEVPSTCTER